jgi:hypothetical protein
MFNWAIGAAIRARALKGIKLFKPNNELVRYLSNDEPRPYSKPLTTSAGCGLSSVGG